MVDFVPCLLLCGDVMVNPGLVANLSVNQLWDSLNRSKSKFNPTQVAKKRNGLPYVDGEIKHLIKKGDK